MQKLQDNLKVAVTRYKRAVTQKTAIHAWDKITVILPEIRTAVIDILDSIGKWRIKIKDNGRPFIWNDVNYVLKV